MFSVGKVFSCVWGQLVESKRKFLHRGHCISPPACASANATYHRYFKYQPQSSILVTINYNGRMYPCSTKTREVNRKSIPNGQEISRGRKSIPVGRIYSLKINPSLLRMRGWLTKMTIEMSQRLLSGRRWWWACGRVTWYLVCHVLCDDIIWDDVMWCGLRWCDVMWCDMSGVSAVRLHGMTEV